MNRTTIALAAIVMILAAACGGGSAAPTSAAPGPSTVPSAAPSAAPSGDGLPPATDPAGGSAGVPDACELLSDDDILELTGIAVAEMRPDPPDTVMADACQWDLVEGPGLVVLGVHAPGGRSYFETAFKPYAQEQGDEPLVGIGDDGLVSEFLGTVMAVQGDVLVDVQAVLPGPGDTEVAERIVARVLENLGG